MKRAVIYARVSTTEQQDNTSLTAQLERTRAHAEDHGYYVVEAVKDVHSGADPDREGLNRIRELAQADQIDVVVINAVDRFMRDAQQAVIVEYELEQEGVKLEFLDLPDEGTPGYRLMKSFYRWLADEEKHKITQRLHGGKRDYVRSGNVATGGKPPFGYREVLTKDGQLLAPGADADEADGKTLAIRDDEAEVVRQIFRWYTVGDGDEGPLSIRAIAKKLTALGIPTYADRRKHPLGAAEKTARAYSVWGASSVSHMLANEVYTGVWRYGKRTTTDQDAIGVPIPAIVDAATWDAVQERKSHNSAFSARNTKHHYLLRGRLRCGDCGRTMNAHTVWGSTNKERRYRYYVCRANTYDLPCNQSVGFRVEGVDAALWDWLKELFSTPEALRQAIADQRRHREELLAPLRKRLAMIEDLIEQRERERDKAMDLYLTSDYDRSWLDDRLARVERQLTGLKDEHAQQAARLAEMEATAQALAQIGELSEDVRLGIEEGEDTFAKRRRVLDKLEVTGTLAIEGDERVLYPQCVVGNSRIVLSDHDLLLWS